MKWVISLQTIDFNRLLWVSVQGEKKGDDDGNDEHIVKKQFYFKKVDIEQYVLHNYIAHQLTIKWN